MADSDQRFYSSPIHAQLIAGWHLSTGPSDFPLLVALHVPVRTQHGLHRKWFIEFYNPDTGMFACEEDEHARAPWPFVQDFEPEVDDWEQIGIAAAVCCGFTFVPLSDDRPLKLERI